MTLINDLQASIAERTQTVHSIKCEPTDYGFSIFMAVGFDDDQIEVTFKFLDTEFDDIKTFDVDVQISNCDHAGLDDLHEALGHAIKEFKRQGFDKACPDVGLERYNVIGM